MSETEDMYRYVVKVSVKNVDALEDLILHLNRPGYLLLDLEERDAYKRLAERDE